MKKQFGYWSKAHQQYVKAASYSEAAEMSNGHVQVLDNGKWRGCGLYEVPESAWKKELRLLRKVEAAHGIEGDF